MTSTVDARLTGLGIELAPPPPSAGAYAGTVRVGGLLYTSGQVAADSSGTFPARGALGAQVDLETGIACARQCALNVLAQAAAALGGLDQVSQVVKLTVFVASTSDFTDQPVVANGASHLINEVFGPAGVHVRSAVGVAALPSGSPVEIEAIFQVENDHYPESY